MVRPRSCTLDTKETSGQSSCYHYCRTMQYCDNADFGEMMKRVEIRNAGLSEATLVSGCSRLADVFAANLRRSFMYFQTFLQ